MDKDALLQGDWVVVFRSAELCIGDIGDTCLRIRLGTIRPGPMLLQILAEAVTSLVDVAVGCSRGKTT